MRKLKNLRSEGFTILELLVVILIIGMILTFAALSVGGGADRTVEQEAKRLTALLRLASEETIMNSKDMVMLISRTQYSFMNLSPDGRQLLPVEKEDITFRPRELPDDVLIKEAEIAGESVSLSVEQDEEDPPKIYIFSSGEMIPFVIQVGRDDGPDYEITGDFTGRVDYEKIDK